MCGCVPTVFSVQKNGSTFVGVRNPPWGFGCRLREFLGGTKAAERYRLQLWNELRALAWAQQDRNDRAAAFALKEAIARIGGAE